MSIQKVQKTLLDWAELPFWICSFCTSEKFKEFKNEVENQLDKKIKILRSDRGGEYLSTEFENYLKECGIVQQLTPPGTPQWNGVSERRNRTLLDMVRSMMSQTNLPTSFWGFALLTAAFTLNRIPSKSVEKTPYEMWFGKVPNISFLKIWGCEAYVKRMTSYKLGPKSDKCIFVGYPKEIKGYYFYHQSENKIVVARHGVFLEKEFLAKGSSGSSVQLEEVQDTLDHLWIMIFISPHPLMLRSVGVESKVTLVQKLHIQKGNFAKSRRVFCTFCIDTVLESLNIPECKNFTLLECNTF
ncbi:Pyruvate dehydrogenase complex component E2 1 [Castilleja foliolosa]|uniref:Pyruvate dehydrogenase complex component E2 1 n=1 Tax=Castilleja foliolosa TaxID=1961234 RepID=A0ABD3EPD5_9LAMI